MHQIDITKFKGVIAEKFYQISPNWLTSLVLFSLSYIVLKSSVLFDESYYLACNPEIAESGQDPVLHYLRRGAIDARNPNPWFDTSFYMSTHPGIISVGINPLFHYIMFGASQGNNPHPLFVTSYYLSENPTVAASGINPLSHFIRNGQKEGLIPHPLLKDVSPKNYLLQSSEKLLTKRMLNLHKVCPDKSRWMLRKSGSFKFKPQITIVLFGAENHEKLTKSVQSISDQAYPYWNLVIARDGDIDHDLQPNIPSLKKPCEDKKVTFLSEQRLLESSDWVSGEFLAFLESGDILTADALFEFVKELNCNPAWDLIYCDECRVNAQGQSDFFFKPGWSPELLWGTNYVGDFFLLKKALFDEIGGLHTLPGQAGLYEVLLRISQCSTHAIRLPKPLVHCLVSDHENSEFEQQVLQKSLECFGQAGEIISLQIPGTYRVKRKINDAPLVSIIIPTACSNPDKNLLPCLRTIVDKTSYSNYEIILLDNSYGKLQVDLITTIVRNNPQLQVIEHSAPFNFSSIMNLGAHKAHGAYLLMLNDDIEVVSPDWIQSMLEYAQLNQVGVVGTKLLYPDGRIQHAGCLITDNRGFSRHAFQYMPDAPDLYFGIGSVARNCSLVTFACVMIRKDLFFELGRLDERFNVEQNDSDFCLRTIAAGYRIVYTPFARLIHKDARSRSEAKIIKVSKNIQQFWDKWRDFIEKGDSFYNPNLSLDSPNYWINDRLLLIEPLGTKTEWLDCAADLEQTQILDLPTPSRSRDRIVIGIDPTSSDTMRSWPSEHFTKISDLLSTKLQASVIINTGAKDFRATMNELDLFIGPLNDNCYLAASMGIPTLVIWPGCTSPEESGLDGERGLVVRMAVPCSPCHKSDPTQCPYNMKCLKMLWPYKVFVAAKQALNLFGRE